ncbi:hypothetical protein [Escherichia coli]|nr:hypothetical protein [Escherichia coli]MCW3365100.1 hypothetical protein [Escherichia coli]
MTVATARRYFLAQMLVQFNPTEVFLKRLFAVSTRHRQSCSA